jgi:uncharacterized RDD family membrane protein YckC
VRDHDDDDGSVLVDPTDVVGRRMAGWLIDLAIVAGTVLVVLLLLGDSFERPGPDTGLDVRRVGSDTAIFLRSTVAVVHAWEWLVAAGVGALAAFLLLILLPARRGWTPGLLAAELRLVDGEGAEVGLRQSIVRFVGWVIDILPGVPVVGLVAMRFGSLHQRLGDRLAHTYVVDRAFAGRPPNEAAPVDADGQVTTLLTDQAPSEDEGDVDSVLTGQTTVRRRSRKRHDPERPPEESTETADPSPASTGESAAPAAVWAPEEGPADQDDRNGGDGADPGDQRGADADADRDDQRPPDSQPSRIPDEVVADEPIWDRGSKRYVMWHGATDRWVAYDDDDQAWRPL